MTDSRHPIGDGAFAGSLLASLKASTREQHIQLHDVVGKLSMLDSLEHYGEALKRYHVAVQTVEREAKAYLSIVDRSRSIAALDWGSRLVKADWIESDLQDLGVSLFAASKLDIVFQIETDDQLVGASYVVEGMTLGGQQMLRAIHGRFGDEASGRTRFFGAYGNQIASKWNQWKSWAIQQDVDAEAAVEAARTTFAIFESALANEFVGPMANRSIADRPAHS